MIFTTVKEKAYAKINLALNVCGIKDGYHLLDGVMTTVDLYDTLHVSKRKDKLITVRAFGRTEYLSEFVPEKDNAYKAAKSFMEKYNTFGADISIQKRIPLSGGMGGSSADASAVLRAMKKLYKVQDDLSDLANTLGSDTAYLLNGGFARISGRGEIIQKLDVKTKLNFVAVYPNVGVNTAECFKTFDSCDFSGEVSNVDSLIDGLKKAENYSWCKECKNALYPSAAKLSQNVKSAYESVLSLSPLAAFMTGSGACVVGLFETKELCSWAADKLKQTEYEVFLLSSV